MMNKRAIIIGAGPAGLTAAYELVSRTDIIPVIIEKTDDIGGISKTAVHRGNRMDIGGHRFFSKSDVILNWWQEMMPRQGSESRGEIPGKKSAGESKASVRRSPAGPDPEKTDRVMLIRNRLSRIFFLGKFFDYPVKINRHTITGLGWIRIIKISLAYLSVKLFPVKKINSLEDFFISRFGRELYETFFKDYTEKIWGVPCREITADWGAQRIKELSFFRTLLHAIKSIYKKDESIEQKNTDTSLIEQFMYPKYGPGQFWETVAALIEEKGGVIMKTCEVTGIKLSERGVHELTYYNHAAKAHAVVKGDYFFSTMPVKDLLTAMGDAVPADVKKVGDGLRYRDSITVGLLLNHLKIKNETKITTLNGLVPDNWIYIQERDVKAARLQIYNNWSPYLVADLNKVWIGLEYCCNEGDDLWKMSDGDLIDFAVDELYRIQMIDKSEVVDGTIIRTCKTYPAYFGTYTQFGVIRNFTDRLDNLFLIGRNGMHRYYNQDHAMLTAITAVSNIVSGTPSRDNIWDINVKEEYLEANDD